MERQLTPMIFQRAKVHKSIMKTDSLEREYGVFDIKQVGKSDRGNDEAADTVASKQEQTLLEVIFIMRSK